MTTTSSGRVGNTSRQPGEEGTGESLSVCTNGDKTDIRLFLSNTREFLTYNDPEGPWYRMPIAGVVNAFLKRDLVPMEDEGGFNLDPDEIAGIEPENVTKRGGLILVCPLRC